MKFITMFPKSVMYLYHAMEIVNQSNNVFVIDRWFDYHFQSEDFVDQKVSVVSAFM